MGSNVPLDETLAAAFANPRMKLRPIWEMFRPARPVRFHGRGRAHRQAPAPAEYDIRVRHTGAIIQPTFFPLELC